MIWKIKTINHVSEFQGNRATACELCYKFAINELFSRVVHVEKRIRIQSFSGPYFLAFELNTKIYSVNLLRIQSECARIRTRKHRIWTRLMYFFPESFKNTLEEPQNKLHRDVLFKKVVEKM